MVEGEEKSFLQEIKRRCKEGEMELRVSAAVKALKEGNQKAMHTPNGGKKTD